MVATANPPKVTTVMLAKIVTQKEMSSEEAANAWRIATVIISVFAAVAAYFTLHFSFKDAREKKTESQAKDRALETYKTDSGKQIASLNAEAEGLKTRAAGLENETAQAKLELEKLKLKQAPRTLTQKQRADFLGILTGVPKRHVRVVSLSPNPEAMTWATQFRELLDAAGFADPQHPGAPEYMILGLFWFSGNDRIGVAG